MRRIGLPAAALLGAAIVAGNGGAAIPTLHGSVSDPVNISLTFGGKKVSSLKAGRYTIVVKDSAGDHDFHLTGPGMNRSTTTGGTGTWTWNVALRKGTYTYVCDPHAAFMKGSFTVK
jgi:Copper binding proteins, plastocyanin/azurin family